MKLTGQLPEGATATDLVLTIVEKLRQHGVVGKFVEFYGPGLGKLSLADRATIANMAPESGYDRASITVGSKRSDPDFHKELKGKRYFFRAHNGRIHGVIEADFVPYDSPDICEIYQEIRLTEDGSRNLAVRR